MLIAICTLLYIATHMIIYVVWLRHLSFLRSEKGILLFHLISWCFAVSFTGVGLLLLRESSDNLLMCIAIASAAHGIYSLTFLELWTLSEGSYSFQLLSAIESSGSVTKQVFNELADVGNQKRVRRIETLIGLGLVRRDGTLLKITPKGTPFAIAMRALYLLCNLRDTG